MHCDGPASGAEMAEIVSRPLVGSRKESQPSCRNQALTLRTLAPQAQCRFEPLGHPETRKCSEPQITPDPGTPQA